MGILRGIGYSIVPMVVSCWLLCAAPAVVWFVFPLDPVPGNLYISYPITWAITGAVHIIMFLAIRKKAYARYRGAVPPICLWMDTIRKRRSSEKKKRLGSLRGDLSASACLKRKNRPTENFSGVMTV